jgi:hypothetical protein
MVLSGTHTAKIITRTNVGGGNKKAGTVPRVGLFMQSNHSLRRAPQRVPLVTVVSNTVQTQRVGYAATLGGS